MYIKTLQTRYNRHIINHTNKDEILFVLISIDLIILRQISMIFEDSLPVITLELPKFLKVHDIV